jgi:hypothetical protein
MGGPETLPTRPIPMNRHLCGGATSRKRELGGKIGKPPRNASTSPLINAGSCLFGAIEEIFRCRKPSKREAASPLLKIVLNSPSVDRPHT